jgi:uncharacterized protein
MTYRLTMIDSASFRHTPWKNGGGTTIDIADEYVSGAVPGDWDNMIWRFGRTPITTPGQFSDLTGIERMQVLVQGRGLVLHTVDGEIDVRLPYRPVRFDGETKIVSELEHGPVEVVNLMGHRTRVEIDLRVLQIRKNLVLANGIHIIYAASELCCFTTSGDMQRLETGCALRIDTADDIVVEGSTAHAIIGSIFRK